MAPRELERRKLLLERNQVKKAARDLLQSLKTEKLVLDWRSRQQSRAEVRGTIGNILNDGLPDKFSEGIFDQKCDLIYEHVYDSYLGEGKSIYSRVG